MSSFHARQFAEAKALFEQAAAGPAVELMHSAQMYIRMCERRMGVQGPPARTPEELYAQATALMNQGQYGQAEPLMQRAVAAMPRADHFLYALALCKGHLGDLRGSADALRQAIEIQPANRSSARRDADFQSLLADGPVRDLVLGERS